jgi:hypothetical protein
MRAGDKRFFLKSFFFIYFSACFSCLIPPEMTKTIRHIITARFANANVVKDRQISMMS